MTTQTLTAFELTAERPEMVESIIELLLADTVVTLLECDENYSYLQPLLVQPGEDIVENYKQVTASIFLFDEYRQLLSLVNQLIDNIGVKLFCDMWETNQSHTLSEVLRCFGHGVSFWDNYKHQEFGFSDVPKLTKTFESPYNVAIQILDKIAAKHLYEEDFDKEILEQERFDQWLTENYEFAREEKGSGEAWYLSKNPHEFMPLSLSEVEKLYNSEFDIPDADRNDWILD